MTAERLKFYGMADFGTYPQMQAAVTLIRQHDAQRATSYSVTDLIELHNAQQFIEHGLFPDQYTDEQRAEIAAAIPKVRSTVARFFSTLDDTNIRKIDFSVEYPYHADLLELFSRHKVYTRCTAPTMMQVFERAGLRLAELLAGGSKLVHACDAELRAKILADPMNAELVIRKHLIRGSNTALLLPPSFTGADARSLIDAYLDSADAKPNDMQLVALARVDAAAGIDGRLKLKAKRAHKRWTDEFFEQNTGIRTGVEVSIIDGQADPMKYVEDGYVQKITYSSEWLEDGLDYSAILDNFIWVFEFMDQRMLLTMPSYLNELGTLERVMGSKGKNDYETGVVFGLKERAALATLFVYERFLGGKDIRLESVVAWFFTDYLRDQYGAEHFTFAPSTTAATYLEKCRHLFSEMESVVKQFALYVEDGQLDLELLSVDPEPIQYRTVPSLVLEKYVYPTDHSDVQNIMRLLFSDQSGLTYIREDLRDDNAAKLFGRNAVSYDDLLNFQRAEVDYLTAHGILVNTGTRIELANLDHILALRVLFSHEAASYYHFTGPVRAAIDDMVDRGWLARRSSLLAEPEVQYFNYCLNFADFGNGPNLRNQYLHGRNLDASDENTHYQTYLIALKLIIALVLKINDDFWLRDMLRDDETES